MLAVVTVLRHLRELGVYPAPARDAAERWAPGPRSGYRVHLISRLQDATGRYQFTASNSSWRRDARSRTCADRGICGFGAGGWSRARCRAGSGRPGRRHRSRDPRAARSGTRAGEFLDPRLPRRADDPRRPG